MRSSRLVVALCLVVAAFAPSPVWAQAALARTEPAATRGGEVRLPDLAARVAELEKMAAEVTAASRSVAELAAGVAAVRRDLETLQRQSTSQVDVSAQLDALDTRLRALSDDVASLRAGLQARHAPEAVREVPGIDPDAPVLTLGEIGSLRISGYAQFRWLGRFDDDFDLEESSFALRRARLEFEGATPSERVSAFFLADFARGEVQPLDIFIDAKLGRGFALRGGQFRVPFSRSWLTRSAWLSFLERSVATEEFRYDRDLGIAGSWTGLNGRLDVIAGVFNGAGKNVPGNDNLDPLLVLRVAGTPVGTPWPYEEGDMAGTRPAALSLGAAVTLENTPVPLAYGYTSGVPAFARPIDRLDADVDLERDNVQIMEAEVDLAFRWRGIGIEAEGYLRKEDWGAIGDAQASPFDPDDLFLGGYAQASWFVLPSRFQVGARYSMAQVSPLAIGGKSRPVSTCVDPIDPTLTFGCALPVSDLLGEASLLAAYYRYGHGMELSAMYSWLDWANDDGVDPEDAGEHRFIVETQVGF